MSNDANSFSDAEPRIFQINISNGGVPKLAVQSAQILEFGVAGDKQSNTVVHGGPDRAVCLYSLERLIELQNEGHPVFPGSLGENLTLVGLDWSLVRPGHQIWVGEVLLEFTKYTKPCSKLAPYLLDSKIERMAESEYPGWSRLYARVLQPGVVRVADPVQLVSG